MGKDKLESLFNKMNIESPSIAFENKLMRRICIESQLIKKKKKRQSAILMISAVLAIILLPFIVSLFGSWSMSDALISVGEGIVLSLAGVVDPFVLSISVVCLSLLVIDLLIRKHIREKDKSREDLS